MSLNLLLCQRHFLAYQRMRGQIQMLLLVVACVLVIFQRASPSLGREGKGDLTNLQLVDVRDNAIVARNGVRNIVPNARVEAVQINVTCLILPALGGVDAVLEQI